MQNYHENNYTSEIWIYNIYNIWHLDKHFSNNLKNGWVLKHLASNKPSTSFPRKLLNCAPQEYSLYSTQIPNLLHVHVILKAQIVMPVQCSHVRRREDISICHFHGRKSHWISIRLSTSPKMNCGAKTS